MKNRMSLRIMVVVLILASYGCKSSKIVIRDENRNVPTQFNNSTSADSTNTADLNWKQIFSDPNLVSLIDSALVNNQELNIISQELTVTKSEAKAKKGEYLPSAGLKLGAGMEKSGEYTRNGAVEKHLEVQEGKAFPEPLGDFMVGAYFSWELDIWKKLRNSKTAAVSRYLASIEGRNFMVTNLVSEIATSYYELLALDNQLEIVNRNIGIQSEAMAVVKQQKEAARVTQLAVNRFEAQLLNTQNLQYEIKQQITETENRINFLVGRFPQPVSRTKATFDQVVMDSIYIGVPSQLLANRPDIRQAEQELIASKLDVKAARANFYPTLSLNANVGFQAFNPSVWFNPQSILYNLVGDLVAPLINRNAIKAAYTSASAKQLQSVYNYEQTILTAYTEVVNQLAGIDNYTKSFETKSKEVDLLAQSVTISNSLFQSARADYMEVLLTQREALQSRMELIEIRLKQLNSQIYIYKSLGGGWK
jgi:multidrug efflux system outer membrane protein